MVKIINGEIVADDDPRLQQRSTVQLQRAGPIRPEGPPGGPAPAGPGTGFNLSAPPLRFVEPAPGVEPLLGLPDVEVFGIRVTLYAVLAAIALGILFGWRGAAIAVVLYYVYIANQSTRQPGQGHGQAPGQPGAHQPQQQQQQQGNAPMDFLTRYLNGPEPPSRSQGPQGGEGIRSGDDHPGGSGGAGEAGGGWAAFKGKGRKLTD